MRLVGAEVVILLSCVVWSANAHEQDFKGDLQRQSPSILAKQTMEFRVQAPRGAGGPPEQEADSSMPGGPPAERLREFLKARLPQNPKEENSKEEKKPEDLNPERLQEEEEKNSGASPRQD